MTPKKLTNKGIKRKLPIHMQAIGPSSNERDNIDMTGAPLTRSQVLLLELIQGLGGKSDDKTKLAKLQYFSDFIHYAFHDKSISQPENLYERRDYGPLSRQFNEDLKALCKADYLEKKGDYLYAAKNKKDYTPLTAKEKKTVNFVVSRYGKASWGELVKIAHSQIPYLAASGFGSVVEYFTAYNLIDEYPEYETFAHA